VNLLEALRALRRMDLKAPLNPEEREALQCLADELNQLASSRRLPEDIPADVALDILEGVIPGRRVPTEPETEDDVRSELTKRLLQKARVYRKGPPRQRGPRTEPHAEDQLDARRRLERLALGRARLLDDVVPAISSRKSPRAARVFSEQFEKLRSAGDGDIEIGDLVEEDLRANPGETMADYEKVRARVDKRLSRVRQEVFAELLARGWVRNRGWFDSMRQLEAAEAWEVVESWRLKAVSEPANVGGAATIPDEEV
jgi:hypothetical protein